MTATKIGNGTFCHPKTVIGSNVHSDVKTGGAMAPLPLFRILADQLTPFQQGVTQECSGGAADIKKRSPPSNSQTEREEGSINLKPTNFRTGDVCIMKTSALG